MEIDPPPIGASMLHLLNATSPGHVDGTVPTSTLPHDKPNATTVASRPCLLRSLNSSSILLQGPPKCGKSSLAMDLACSCAADACLRGCGAPCSCVAAIIYRPIADADLDGFPLQCLAEKEEAEGFAARYQQLDMDMEWDSQLLQRISVRYISSAREVLADLLAIPLTQQPLGAIIVDDIDKMSAKEANPNGFMMQLLAVAADTGKVLGQLHRTKPVILATLQNAVAAPWIESHISIRSADEHIKWTVAQELSTLSKWQVTNNDPKGGILSKAQSICSEYVVARSPVRGPRIHWRNIDNSTA